MADPSYNVYTIANLCLLVCLVQARSLSLVYTLLGHVAVLTLVLLLFFELAVLEYAIQRLV